MSDNISKKKNKTYMILLAYINRRTNTTISVFDTIGDYPYSTNVVVGATTMKENRFKTQEEALRDFMWLVSSNIIKEEI